MAFGTGLSLDEMNAGRQAASHGWTPTVSDSGTPPQPLGVDPMVLAGSVAALLAIIYIMGGD